MYPYPSTIKQLYLGSRSKTSTVWYTCMEICHAHTFTHAYARTHTYTRTPTHAHAHHAHTQCTYVHITHIYAHAHTHACLTCYKYKILPWYNIEILNIKSCPFNVKPYIPPLKILYDRSVTRQMKCLPTT